jgi:hypothetical protein
VRNKDTPGDKTALKLSTFITEENSNMVTAPTPPPKRVPALPQVSLVVGGRMVPAQIRAAAFQGGILETQAKIAKGSWIPLNLLTETPAIVHIHVLEVSEGKLIFRLYGTDGHARTIWERLVQDLKESEG